MWQVRSSPPAGNFYPELTQGGFDWPDFLSGEKDLFAKFLKIYPGSAEGVLRVK
jgi:hypothetical protein